MDIAVARGIVYWTQFDATASAGNVGIVNPTAARTVARYISTGKDTPVASLSVVIKSTGTEMTGTVLAPSTVRTSMGPMLRN